MRTHFILLTGLFFVSAFYSAQNCPCGTFEHDQCICEDWGTLLSTVKIQKEDICDSIHAHIYRVDEARDNADSDDENVPVITDYTFRRGFANDFAKILLQENSFSNLNAHADLKIDPDASKVTFNPFVFHPKLGFEPFSYFGTVGFSGEIDNDQVSKLFDSKGINKKFQLNANLNLVLGGGGYYTVDDQCYEKFSHLRHRALDAICDEYTKKVEHLNDPGENSTDLADEFDWFCDREKMTEDMWNKFADVEEKLAKSFWTSNWKSWLNLSVAPLGYSSYSGIDVVAKNLVTKEFYDPSLKITYNFLRNWVHDDRAFYFNIWGKIANKTSFTGKSTSTWNQMMQLTENTWMIEDTKDAYAYDPDDYTEAALPDFGTQIIGITDICPESINMPLGLDISWETSFMPHLRRGDKMYYKHTFSGGIIFPFNNKDGERVINFEIFYSKWGYSISELASSDFVGLKFSIPIFSRE